MVSSTYLVVSLIVPLWLILGHLLVSPYTKVEESFNIQATHDILKYGIPTRNASALLEENYDHMTFPGAVPRTFVGSVALAQWARLVIGLYPDPSIDQQFLVRGGLGLFNAYAIWAFASRAEKAFGTTTAVWYLLFQVSQFHIFYYASRPLPNTFAFVISTFALASLLPQAVSLKQGSRRYKLGLIALTVAGIVFRSELALLLLAYVVTLWTRGQVTLRGELIPAGIVGVVFGLALTVPLDSYFWQSKLPLWPELEAFISNIFPPEGSEGASAWGTSPWYWYYTSALPRLLLNPLAIPLIIASFLIPLTRTQSSILTTPSLLFITLFSFLPHKETRFIMYTIPILTLSASLTATYIWNRRAKSPLYRLLSLIIILSTILTSLLSHALLLPISSLNYPGGHALQRLHFLVDGTKPAIHVHLDNLSLQTGITRFHQFPPPNSSYLTHEIDAVSKSEWIYDKTENSTLLLTPEFWEKFTHVITESPSLTPGSWEIISTIHGFGGFRILGPDTPSDPELGTGEVLRRMYGQKIASLWDMVAGTLEKGGRKVLGGRWMEISMRENLFLLRKGEAPVGV